MLMENINDTLRMLLTGGAISAHSLGLTLVAEGVEEKEQLDWLIQAECEEIQGYYFHPPLNADDFTALLKQSKHDLKAS